MKLLVLSICLLIGATQNCLAAVSGRGPGGPGGEPPVFDCSDKVGYYADLWKNCEVYYQCLEDGTKLTFGCPSHPQQTYFDEAIVQCVDNYVCPEPEPISPV
ncbi:hypothetical protein OUZ56_013785 [Daphnia magna]|uniref:Chitin-binding type-2 domain-containing protein n=1 Tax=Daphnia magna TaxID=35525 RepID=A0ABQ9Z6X8_9CRUS|nr:hypothetical protein OUZ56_013785 [Daphnia magna]